MRFEAAARAHPPGWAPFRARLLARAWRLDPEACGFILLGIVESHPRTAAQTASAIAFQSPNWAFADIDLDGRQILLSVL